MQTVNSGKGSEIAQRVLLSSGHWLARGHQYVIFHDLIPGIDERQCLFFPVGILRYPSHFLRALCGDILGERFPCRLAGAFDYRNLKSRKRELGFVSGSTDKICHGNGKNRRHIWDEKHIRQYEMTSRLQYAIRLTKELLTSVKVECCLHADDCIERCRSKRKVRRTHENGIHTGRSFCGDRKSTRL